MSSMSVNALNHDIPTPKKKLLEELDEYDFIHVAEKAAQEWPNLNLDELIKDGIPQLRRYYAMRIVYGNDMMVALPIRVDPLAHTHVLFTKEYREFCDKFFGEFFDHWPCDRKDRAHMEWLGEGYKATLARMDAAFNDRDKDWWPDLVGSNFDDICCGCQCFGQ